MRMTPLEIKKRSFGESFRGYDRQEVDTFIDRIAAEYEILYRENLELREKLRSMEKRLKDYVEMEKTLKAALIESQKAADEMKMQAKREAEIIKREAKLEAERILADAKSELKELLNEIQALKRKKTLLKIELKSILDGYYKMIEEDEVKARALKVKAR